MDAFSPSPFQTSPRPTFGGAVGLEVNGVNRSLGNPTVYGLNIVMAGSRQTRAALVLETSNVEPGGIPHYAIIVGGPNTTGAANLAATTIG